MRTLLMSFLSGYVLAVKCRAASGGVEKRNAHYSLPANQNEIPPLNNGLPTQGINPHWSSKVAIKAIDEQMDELCHFLTLFKWSGYKNHGKEVNDSAEKLVGMVSKQLGL